MLKRVREYVLMKLKEWIVEIIVTLLLSCIGMLATSYIPIKNQLVKHPFILLVLLAIMVPTTALCLILAIRVYWRYGRFFETFGVFWDKNDNMRCLSCKKPLKHSSTDQSIFYCSDPKCNSKHVLKKSDGTKITRGDALIHLKGLRTLRKVKK